MDALDLMLARRSVHRFTAQDAAPETRQKLIDAAFAAPSANNARPWHFVLVRDPPRARGSRPAPVDLDARQGPLVIAVLGNDDETLVDEDSRRRRAENILLEATALGLGSVWCGMREDPGAVRRV